MDTLYVYGQILHTCREPLSPPQQTTSNQMWPDVRVAEDAFITRENVRVFLLTYLKTPQIWIWNKVFSSPRESVTFYSIVNKCQ